MDDVSANDSNQYVKKYANIGNSDEFARWIDIAFKMYHSPEKAELYVLSTESEDHLKLEDYEKAYQTFHRIYEIYGKGAFRGEDINYYKFMRYYKSEMQKATLDEKAIKAFLAQNNITPSTAASPTNDEIEENELPDDIDEKVESLSQQGEDLFDNNQVDATIEKWRDALQLLPKPRAKWQASL